MHFSGERRNTGSFLWVELDLCLYITLNEAGNKEAKLRRKMRETARKLLYAAKNDADVRTFGGLEWL